MLIAAGFRPDTDYTGERSGTRWVLFPAHVSDEQALDASGLHGWRGDGPWSAGRPVLSRSLGHVLVKRREVVDL